MDSRWSQVELIRARLAEEVGTLTNGAPLRVALCYPSPYQVGMSSLGMQTIYREIHAHAGAAAERAFLPDDVEAARAAGAPLLTYETQAPVAEHPIIAFSVAYELELPGVFEMLRLSGLPLLARERDARHPLVVAGGPLTFSNPEPLEPFVDLVLTGEAEETVHELLELAAAAVPKAALLDALAGRAGFWVTGRGLPLPPPAKASEERLPAFSQIVTPNTELRSMFLVEAGRGCSRGCTYCVMRRTTNGGMRPVPVERVLERIPAAARRVGLVGAAVTDHPKIAELLRRVVDGGRTLGISSLRADRLTPELVGLLARGGYRTLTVAADGASQRLRDAIDRKTHEQHLLRAAQLAREAGLAKLKVYMMLGLPNETEEDIDELARLGRELSKLIPVCFGIAPFAAKRNTPLDGAPFEPIASLEARFSRLKKGLRGQAEVKPSSARWAWVEYMLAQGGAEAGLAARTAWEAGGSFAAWKRAFAEHGVAPRRVRPVQDGRRNVPALAWQPSGPAGG